MKNYKLEILFDNNEIGVHEVTSEGIDVIQARLIVSVLEEYKQRMLTYITFSQDQKTINLKKQTKQ